MPGENFNAYSIGQIIGRFLPEGAIISDEAATSSGAPRCSPQRHQVSPDAGSRWRLSRAFFLCGAPIFPNRLTDIPERLVRTTRKGPVYFSGDGSFRRLPTIRPAGSGDCGRRAPNAARLPARAASDRGMRRAQGRAARGHIPARNCTPALSSTKTITRSGMIVGCFRTKQIDGTAPHKSTLPDPLMY